MSRGDGGSAYPKSVQAGIPKLWNPAGWPVVRIGDIFNVVQRPFHLRDDDEYQLVTAKRNRGGVVSRERLTGKSILTKTQFRIAAGDFLISRRQIAHGACGIVPEKLAGAVVSNEYATLLPSDLLDPAFMRHLPELVYFQQTCFHSSVGVHVEKLVFNLEEWLTWPIPMPTKDGQRRIAAILDEWDEAVDLAASLGVEKLRRHRGLVRGVAGLANCPREELENFASLIRTKEELGSGDESSIELDNIEKGTGRLLGETPADGLKGQRAKFTAGDVLFGKLRPYLRKFFYAQKPGLASTEFWVMRADPNKCRNRFLYYLVQQDAFASEAQRPTGSKMPRAEWELVRAAPLPLPKLNVQDELINALDSSEASALIQEDAAGLLHMQKRGLMQKLLTGEWTVPESIDRLLPGGDLVAAFAHEANAA